ncbi:UPF0337 protein [Trichinella spiralis]|uniref:UPF0337 protein n=1 Tax=Trichinella spiralis TaxID=6334 RepID=A0ABR3KGI5_TRISP
MFRCPICEDLHRVQRCRKYLAMSTSERWKTAKQRPLRHLSAWYGRRKTKIVCVGVGVGVIAVCEESLYIFIYPDIRAHCSTAGST